MTQILIDLSVACNSQIINKMPLWQKLKRIATAAKNKTKQALRKIATNRPIILRSVFAKNAATILISLFYKRDRLKPALSKQTQMIAEMQIPRIFRESIYTAYSKFYAVNLKEIQHPLKEYPTFSSFFTRKITRSWPAEIPYTVSSPCDGKILVLEEVTGDKCQIIKGAKYSLSELVTGINKEDDPNFIRNSLKVHKNTKLFQLVIYLAPGDYHRFHSPVNMDIIKRLKIDGRCESVSEKTIAKGKPIYQKNGRITVTSKWAGGLMTMVMVGALNVMRIHITEQNKLERGDQLGYFNLGSTIIMIVQAKEIGDIMASIGSKVKVGEPLFRYC